MSKRGKDLFYLLEQREQGVRSEEPEVRTRSTPARSSGSLGASVRQWFAGGGARPARGRAASGSGSPAPFGLIVSAVALLALGVGFALGRFLPKAPAAPELAARTESTAPRRPGPVEAQKPALGELTAEKEEESLSNRWFRLLQFDAPQRADAAPAATFLRANGVETARIRKFPLRADKREAWFVMAYVVAPETPQTLLAKLKAVPASRIPDLSRRLGKLSIDDLERPE